MIALGGVGIVSVASNEIPHEMAAMTRAALNNDWATARSIHRKYLPLMQANFIESSPLPVKAVLAMMGKIEESYRLPLVAHAARHAIEAAENCHGGWADRETGCARARSGRSFIFMKTGRPVRIRSCCTADPADNAIRAKAVPPGTTPTTRAGTGRMRHLVQGREAAHGMTGVLIRSECKCV